MGACGACQRVCGRGPFLVLGGVHAHLALPLKICEIMYDPYLGYPTDIVTDCAIPASECRGASDVESPFLLAD